mmetsp:Transcript_8296/g.15474  ORF Transcript_8296/g.15474 Transcript_8296/m.15474 type:complete len:653 (+) Transcript_8296:188-2146(+)
MGDARRASRRSETAHNSMKSRLPKKLSIKDLATRRMSTVSGNRQFGRKTSFHDFVQVATTKRKASFRDVITGTIVSTEPAEQQPKMALLAESLFQRKESLHLLNPGPSRPRGSKADLFRSMNKRKHSFHRVRASRNLQPSDHEPTGVELRTPRKQVLWRKVRTAIRVATIINRLVKQTSEARRSRITRRWDRVRQISMAALSINLICDKRDSADTEFGVKNYTRFERIIRTHPSARSNVDLDFLMQSTKHLSFFNQVKASESKLKGDNNQDTQVSPLQHREMCRCMTLRRFEGSHEYIFKQGDPGGEFFVTLSGTVAVYRTTGTYGVSRLICKLGAGSCFGELALSQTSSVRTASIVTVEPSAFLVVKKEDYARILKSSHQDAFDKKTKFLRSVHAFRSLSDKDIFNIAVCLQVRKARVGDCLVEQGDPFDPLTFLLVIKTGEVEILKRIDSEVVKLCVMGKTEAICDWDTLDQVEEAKYTYPFTAKASTLVEYYFISRHDIIGKLSKNATDSISRDITRIPHTDITKSMLQASNAWKNYKHHLVKSIINNKKKRRNTKKANAVRAPNIVLDAVTINARKHRRSSCFERRRTRLESHTPPKKTTTTEKPKQKQLDTMTNEVSNTLKDGLHRHVYDSILSEGARFYWVASLWK